MKPKEGNRSTETLEVTDITPGETWFDPIGIRYFINTTQMPVRIGFGHNVRAVEIVVILDPKIEVTKRIDPKGFEGEVIEEAV